MALGYGLAGNRRLAFQNLLQLGRLEPTVGNREPILLFVLASSGFGLASRLCRDIADYFVPMHFCPQGAILLGSTPANPNIIDTFVFGRLRRLAGAVSAEIR